MVNFGLGTSKKFLFSHLTIKWQKMGISSILAIFYFYRPLNHSQRNSSDNPESDKHYQRPVHSYEDQRFWLVYVHSEAQIVNFRRWSSIPDVHFCPELRVLMVELNVFYKKILFVTVYCIFQTRTLRIQYSQFGTKMYIWYTAPSAKINYLGFTMSVNLIKFIKITVLR